MKKKLVRYDAGRFSELDPIRLKRKALVLREKIFGKISKDNDPYLFYKNTLPIVEAALRGEITAPLDQDAGTFIDENYVWNKREGTLPKEYDNEFASALAGFSVTVRGLSLEKTEDIVVDGVTHRWLDLEEDGDWPDKVKFP